MKRAIAILLLVVYMVSLTDIVQMMKLPAFFEHYAEHKQANKSITFLEFLHMHYAHGDVNDEDQAKDRKLPFKSPSSCACISIVEYVPLNNGGINIAPISIDTYKYRIYSEDFISSSFLSSIWQPPKFC